MSSSEMWKLLLSQLLAALMPILIKLIVEWLEGELAGDKAIELAPIGVALVTVLEDAEKATNPEDWLSINRSPGFKLVAGKYAAETGGVVPLVA